MRKGCEAFLLAFEFVNLWMMTSSSPNLFVKKMVWDYLLGDVSDIVRFLYLDCKRETGHKFWVRLRWAREFVYTSMLFFGSV